jgi:hypothetical protein
MWGACVAIPCSCHLPKTKSRPNVSTTTETTSIFAAHGKSPATTLEATDGKIGHVAGFLVDDRNWAIRELVVEAGHWYSGKEIRIPTSKVERISYKDMKVFVNLSKADIHKTPEHAIVPRQMRAVSNHIPKGTSGVQPVTAVMLV